MDVPLLQRDWLTDYYDTFMNLYEAFCVTRERLSISRMTEMPLFANVKQILYEAGTVGTSS